MKEFAGGLIALIALISLAVMVVAVLTFLWADNPLFWLRIGATAGICFLSAAVVSEKIDRLAGRADASLHTSATGLADVHPAILASRQLANHKRLSEFRPKELTG